jgi:predicted nucleic acid-binding protein
MGLILDTSILVRAERHDLPIARVLQQLQQFGPDQETGISSVTVAELAHGIYRAASETQRQRRSAFLDQVCKEIIVQPLTESIARLLGRIEGEQAAQGISIAFEDLAIGATALALGFSVATHNIRHFQLIPGLVVLTL